MKTNEDLFSGYFKIIRLTFTFILLTSLGLGFLQFMNRLDKEKNAVKERFKQNSVNLELILSACVQHVQALRNQANDYLNIVENQTAEPLYNYLAYNKEGNYFHLDNLPPLFPKEYTANITGDIRLDSISELKKREINMAISLNRMFRATAQNVPNVAWVYYVSHDFISIYPWNESKKFKFTPKLLDHEFYANALPEANPTEEVFWTPAYIDEAGKGLMVTCSAPVYEGRSFRGSLSLDITTDSLNAIITSSQMSMGKIFLINESNQLIAHPDLVHSKDTAVRRFEEALPEALREDLIDISKLRSNELHHIQGYYLYYENVPNSHWKAVFIVEVVQMYNTVLMQTGGMILFTILCVSLVVLVSNRIIRRDFIMPAQAFVQHIQNENENTISKIPRIPLAWEKWFDLITNIFSTKRMLMDRLEQQNKNLEYIVQVRTEELKVANAELKEKNEALQTSEGEIRKNSEKLKIINEHLEETNERLVRSETKLKIQHDELQTAYSEIRIQNQKITASINSAFRIQKAMLAEPSEIRKHFKDCFIWYQPKEIVSGDFYWFSKQANLKILAVADCTGHSVPGAFMTVIGTVLLNEIVNGDHIIEPSQILRQLESRMLAITEREHYTKQISDGMEISVVIIDENKKEIHHASADGKVYLYTQNNLVQIKGAKHQIGRSEHIDNKDFITNSYSYKEGDILYLFSDGFQDQFGGDQNTKYLSTKFRSFIKEIATFHMETQKEKFVSEFYKWKGGHTQTDDILIVGVRL